MSFNEYVTYDNINSSQKTGINLFFEKSVFGKTKEADKWTTQSLFRVKLCFLG